ncbi:MAG: hypothetical protein IJ833_09975 [Lachnospiraceae bacterium]|nr:hypothetical protein [Lachnospiraceae bacterium]
MDEKVLENVYQERLEERIIAHLAEWKGLTYGQAMSIYYHSALADKIHEGREGIQYLDYKVLADILQETEPELFRRISC